MRLRAVEIDPVLIDHRGVMRDTEEEPIKNLCEWEASTEIVH